MSIASMTGFARVNGNVSLGAKNVCWVWELKSVNGKGLDIKYKLPNGFDDLAGLLKPMAMEVLNRGSISVCLDVNYEKGCKKVKIDEDLLAQYEAKILEICNKKKSKFSYPTAVELLGLRGVTEFEDEGLNDEEMAVLTQKLIQDFVLCCKNLQDCRRQEGQKINKAFGVILAKIEDVVVEIEKIAAVLPQKIREKLKAQLEMYADDVNISDERIAQEIVLLVTRADIREEIDRLKLHIAAARELLKKNEPVGRRLDFLCQELNREANTTCSKAADIAITNYGMELKALIEQFREQVQNIE